MKKSKEEAQNAIYLLPTKLRIGAVTAQIMEMIATLRPSSNITVTSPDVQKLEAEIALLRAKLEKAIQQRRSALNRAYGYEAARTHIEADDNELNALESLESK